MKQQQIMRAITELGCVVGIGANAVINPATNPDSHGRCDSWTAESASAV